MKIFSGMKDNLYMILYRRCSLERRRLVSICIILKTDLLKYVHVELALCFLVTNYIYPNKIDRLTYHSIAKVAPVLSEKSP